MENSGNRSTVSGLLWDSWTFSKNVTEDYNLSHVYSVNSTKMFSVRHNEPRSVGKLGKVIKYGKFIQTHISKNSGTTDD